MLATIRKPYLNFDSRSPLSRQASSRNIDLAGHDQSWTGIRHLSNEERDQIDLQARVILSRCSDRVKEMDILEKRTSRPRSHRSLIYDLIHLSNRSLRTSGE